MSSPDTPFRCTCTPGLPALLARLGCSLALSTYQAGKVVLVAADGDRLVQLARNFRQPMGMAA
ncbi:MAG TPA: DUF4915 domain-containing protein, partial [bacterium]|nr:DUF4915 domain-containing protein [bacterium]